MSTSVISQPFSNLQLELLKLYQSNVLETDLIQIKLLLARFFAEKAMDEADKIWEQKGYTAKYILTTHKRTPYRKTKNNV